MVLLIIIPMKNAYFIGNINPTFSDKAISLSITTIIINIVVVLAHLTGKRFAGCLPAMHGA